MVVTSAEIRARRSLIIWLIVSLFCISAEIVALVIVSMSTERIDTVLLMEQRAAMQRTVPQEHKNVSLIKGKSLAALLTQVSDALAPHARLARTEITPTGATIVIEAQKIGALNNTLRSLLAHPHLHDVALITRSTQEGSISATLMVPTWES